MLLSEIALAVLIVIACVTALLRLHALRQSKRDEHEVKFNQNGFATVRVANIESIKLKNKPLEAFPVEFQKYIDKPTGVELSRILMDMPTTHLTPEQRDLKRVMTIVSAIYSSPIPKSLVQMDGRTKELYIGLRNELQVVPVTKINQYDPVKHPVESHIRDAHAMIRLLDAYMVLIGSILMTISRQGVYPSLDNFVVKVNRAMKTTLTKKEVMSLVTAYAGYTEVKIPRSYVSYDWMSVGLMQSSTDPTEKKLTLVK